MDTTIQTKQKSVKLKKNVYGKGDVIFYWLLLIVPLLQICVFYVAVNFNSILLVFQWYDDGKYLFSLKGDVFYGLKENLNTFLGEASKLGFWQTVGNSFLVWLITSLAGTTLAVMFAYYVYKKYPLGNFFRFVLFLPSIIPAVMLTVMFRGLCGDIIPAVAENWFHHPLAKDPIIDYGTHRFWLATTLTLWIGFGSQVLVYTGAMDQIPAEQLEAAQLDGASPFREFISIILPSIIATIGTFLTTGVASIFTNQNNLLALVGNGAKEFEQTMGYKIYMLCYDYGGKDAYPYAAFLGILCTLVVVPLALGIRKAVEKVQE
jgi:multiple sugar transport system permease protein